MHPPLSSGHTYSTLSPRPQTPPPPPLPHHLLTHAQAVLLALSERRVRGIPILTSIARPPTTTTTVTVTVVPTTTATPALRIPRRRPRAIPATSCCALPPAATPAASRSPDLQVLRPDGPHQRLPAAAGDVEVQVGPPWLVVMIATAVARGAVHGRLYLRALAPLRMCVCGGRGAEREGGRGKGVAGRARREWGGGVLGMGGGAGRW